MFLLLALLIVGVIQLNPPADKDEQYQEYHCNTYLMLDLLCEESFKGSPEAKEMLVRYLEKEELYIDLAVWKNRGEKIQ